MRQVFGAWGLFALLASAIILLALLKKISLTLCQCLPIFRISQSFYSAWCLRCAEGYRYFALLRLSLGISAQLFSCDGQNGLKYFKIKCLKAVLRRPWAQSVSCSLDGIWCLGESAGILESSPSVLVLRRWYR